MTNKIAISFFAGAGGLDMGIHKAGFDIKLAVELEEKYCETLRINHPDWNIRNGNIMDYNKSEIFEHAKLNNNQEVDLIFGGSPCQSFSTAGKRQAFDDPRGQAMIKYAEIVEEVQPKVFLLENVRGLLSTALKHRPLNRRGDKDMPLSKEEERGSALKYLLKQFKSYNVTYKLINAAEYGVPQKRERVFLVGVRKDLEVEFQFPEITHQKNKWISVAEVFEKIREVNVVHEYVKYSAERMKYMKMIPKGGGNWRDLPEDIVQEAMGGAYLSGGGKVGFFRRIKLHAPAPTLLTSPIQKSTNIGHPNEDRPLSIQEYLVIQGFPIDYEVNGTLTDKYRQIGNAVPVHLAYVMGNAIFNTLY